MAALHQSKAHLQWYSRQHTHRLTLNGSSSDRRAVAAMDTCGHGIHTTRLRMRWQRAPTKMKGMIQQEKVDEARRQAGARRYQRKFSREISTMDPNCLCRPCETRYSNPHPSHVGLGSRLRHKGSGGRPSNSSLTIPRSRPHTTSVFSSSRMSKACTVACSDTQLNKTAVDQSSSAVEATSRGVRR